MVWSNHAGSRSLPSTGHDVGLFSAVFDLCLKWKGWVAPQQCVTGLAEGAAGSPEDTDEITIQYERTGQGSRADVVEFVPSAMGHEGPV